MKAEYRRTDTIHLTMSVDEAEKVRTLAQDARDHKDLYWALNTALNELAQAERPAPAPVQAEKLAEPGLACAEPVPMTMPQVRLACGHFCLEGGQEYAVAVKDGDGISFLSVCMDCQRELLDSGHYLTRTDIEKVLHRDKWSAP